MEIQVRLSYMTALAELGTAEQKRIGKLIEKLERDPTTNGQNIEQINNGFISIRANQDIRVIGQQVRDAIILHYIDHHEEAYNWANKRKRLAELTGGGYRLTSDDTANKELLAGVPSIPPQNNTDYGTAIFNQLIGLGFPKYIPRSLETTQNEDELYERLENLPENLRMATLEAILDGISYGAILSREAATTSKVALLPQEGKNESNSSLLAEPHEETKPTAPTVEASTVANADASTPLPVRENQGRNVHIDNSLINASNKVEAELQRLEKVVSTTTLQSIAGDLRVERANKPNSTMWLLQIYDGDTLIGSYERSATESGAKEKEAEILWFNRPDLRKIAADELRKAYAKNGNKPFIVRWAGKAIGQDGKMGVKQIRNKETGEILGEFPRSCFRK